MSPAGPGRREAMPGWALSAVVVLATLGRGGDWPPVMLLVHAAVAALIVAVVLTGRADPPPGRLAAGPVAAFSAFIAVATTGAALAPYGYGAFSVVLELFVFLAVAVLAARIGTGLVPILSWPLLAAGALQGAYVLAQRFVAGQLRPPGTFLNTNHLGAWFAAVLLLAAATWPARAGAWTHATRAALALVVASGFAITESRGAFVGFSCGGLFLVATAWRSLGPRARRGAIVACVIGAIALGVVLMQRFRPSEISPARPGASVGDRTAGPVSRATDPVPYHRIPIWRSSLGAFLEHPSIGLGPGQFRWASQALQFPDGDGALRYDRRFTTTHSDYVRVLCEFGLLGAVALAIAIFLAARRVWRVARREPTGVGRHALGAIAIFVAWSVHAVFENLSYRPALYLLGAALAGSLLSLPGPARPPFGRLWRGLAFAGVFTLFTVGDVGPFLAWNVDRSIPGNPPPLEEVSRLEKAASYNRVQPYIRMRLAEALAGDGTRWDAPRYARAREAAETAVRLQPLDGYLRVRLARIEAMACRTLFPNLQSRERAKRRFAEAGEATPFTPFVPLEEAGFLLGTSDFEGAARAADRAIEIEPNAIPPRLLKAHALLDLQGERANPEARRLLAEGEQLAERYRDEPRISDYTRRLLTLDRREAERLAARLRLTIPDGGP